MSIVVVGAGVNGGLMGVNTPTGIVWVDAGDTLSQGNASCIGDTCYSAAGGFIQMFSAGAHSQFSYEPTVNALTPLLGNATTGRFYLVVNSVPVSVHSTVDFVTWDTSANFPPPEVYRSAAIGVDGLYVATTEEEVGYMTLRIYHIAASGVKSLFHTYAPTPTAFNSPVTVSMAVINGAPFAYLTVSTEAEGRSYVNGGLIGQVVWGISGSGVWVRQTATAMSASGGVYAAYDTISADGTFTPLQGYSQGATGFSALSEWGGDVIPTQDGIVGVSALDGSACLYVNGTIVERVSASNFAYVCGALSYAGLVPFWTARVGCIERS